MNFLDKCMAALTYRGNRFGMAWRMAVGSYYYTRAHDGLWNGVEHVRMTRWYAFKGAVTLWWDYIRRPR